MFFDHALAEQNFGPNIARKVKQFKDPRSKVKDQRPSLPIPGPFKQPAINFLENNRGLVILFFCLPASFVSFTLCAPIRKRRLSKNQQRRSKLVNVDHTTHAQIFDLAIKARIYVQRRFLDPDSTHAARVNEIRDRVTWIDSIWLFERASYRLAQEWWLTRWWCNPLTMRAYRCRLRFCMRDALIGDYRIVMEPSRE